MQTKSQVMDNVRNLGYVRGDIAVEKVDQQQSSSDRMSRPRQSVFDIKPLSTGSIGTSSRARQPIDSESRAASRRSLVNSRVASS